jgi:twinfilin-like protein
MLYFIFHSPDTAPVQQRMKHTLAIPGLLVHAEDAGIQVDRKIETHDHEDLVFESGDDRVGRFRSVYARKGVYKGTEMQYAGLERDREWNDSVS